MEVIKKWGPLFVLGLALAIIIIDTTLLNVSIGTIIRELNTDIQSLQWVITTYSLTLAALTITGGRLGDLFGRKRMFMLGAILFAIGSFIASISPNATILLLGESIIEGVGAALMMPATASLLVSNYKESERAIAFGIWGGIAGASSAIGPILGGYLTNNYSWRWGFRINVVVVLLLLAGSVIVRESKERGKTSLDIIGVLLSSIGLLGIVFGIVESSTYGWWNTKAAFSFWGTQLAPFGLSVVPFSITVGFVVLAFFFMWERHIEKIGRTPLVSLELFSNRVFTSGIFTLAIVMLGQVGMIFGLPIFLQSVLRLDAFETGLALLPLSLAILVMAPLSGFISRFFQPKYIILAGLLLNAFGVLLLRNSIGTTIQTIDLAPGLIVFGAGMGMIMAQISNMTLSSVPVSEVGEASGINKTMRQIGSTLGSAIIGAVFLTTLTTNMQSGIQNSSNFKASVKESLVKEIGDNASSVEFGGSSYGSTMPKHLIKEVTRISHQATVVAAKQSLLYTIAFTLLAFLVALTLPAKKSQLNEKMPVGGH